MKKLSWKSSWQSWCMREERESLRVNSWCVEARCCRGPCGEQGGSLLEGGACLWSDPSGCCAVAIWTPYCASARSCVLWWESESEMPLLPGCADLHGLALCRREHSAAWAAWHRARWQWRVRAKCSCTADTVEYLEHCCKGNQGEMDLHPQEGFLKQNRRV